MILRVETLCKKFADRVVLSDLSLEIDRGTVLALCGPSGAGKTTLIRILGGLIGFDAGRISMGNRSITEADAYPPELYGKIGLVFQDHNLFPHMTAVANVELALRRVRRLEPRAARDRAIAELDGLGLAGLADRYPSSLSGGERQRVAIARALAMDPLLLLLDEITSFLDPSLVGEVLSCILRLSQRGTTMLLVTHNLAFAKQAASRFGVLEGGGLTVSNQPEILDRLTPGVALSMDFHDYVFADPYFGWLLRGVAMTLLVTALTTVASLLLSFVVASWRLSPRTFWRAIGTAYVAIFRNLPPLPLLLFLLFGLPEAFRAVTGLPLPLGTEFPLLIAGLSLNTSAYLAETIRSGVRAVPAEQWDAGRVLGLPRRTVLRRIIYPQALRIALPALGTRLIHNMKNSTLALALPLSVNYLEVVGQAGRIAGQTFAWAEPLLFAAGVHMTLALSLGLVVSRLARRAELRVEVAR